MIPDDVFKEENNWINNNENSSLTITVVISLKCIRMVLKRALFLIIGISMFVCAVWK